MSDSELPAVEDIHAVHERIVDEWDVSYTGTRAILPDRTLQSILDDVREIDDDYRRAAALLRRLVNAHVYEDANKRTAWAVAETYLHEVGETVAPTDEEAVKVLLHLRRFDEAELETWLRIGDIDEDRFRDT